MVWIKQQKTGKHKTVNRDKIVIVDQEISWEEVNPRPVRKTRPVHNATTELQHLMGEQNERNLQGFTAVGLQRQEVELKQQ